MTHSSDAAFSYATRAENVAAMVADPVDLLIIGAGITGAGIARDAAMRGIRTAVVDRGDFGNGASGRSSRLVHGGLRHLEAGRYRYVYRSCRERRTLMRIAPHLVRPLPFVFPVHSRGRIPIWKLAAGLLVYDALALFRNVRRHRLLGKQGVLRLEPSLRSHDLRGGAVYFEARCLDARLTLATIRSAFRHGALAANHLGVVELALADGRVYGARLADQLDGGGYTVRARCVVNATGPEVDDVRALGGPVRDGSQLVERTTSSFVVLTRQRLGVEHAVTIVSPIDGRILFVIPWDTMCLVGAAAGGGDGEPDLARATAQDVVYLLRSVNAYFPGARLAPEDVVSTWSRVTPLLPSPPGRPLAGEQRIVEDRSGLISVAGGAFTTHRAAATEVVDLVAERLREHDGRTVSRPAPTDTDPLPGGEVADLDVLTSDLIRQGFVRSTAAHLVASYGTESAAIARIVETDPSWGVPLVGDHPAIRAEVVHVIRREMAVTLSDILIRRIALFYEVIGHAVPEAPAIVDIAGDELGWNAARKAAELAAYLEAIQHSMAFREELPG